MTGFSKLVVKEINPEEQRIMQLRMFNTSLIYFDNCDSIIICSDYAS